MAPASMHAALASHDHRSAAATLLPHAVRRIPRTPGTSRALTVSYLSCSTPTAAHTNMVFFQGNSPGSPTSIKKFRAGCAQTGRTAQCCNYLIVGGSRHGFRRIVIDFLAGRLWLLLPRRLSGRLQSPAESVPFFSGLS